MKYASPKPVKTICISAQIGLSGLRHSNKILAQALEKLRNRDESSDRLPSRPWKPGLSRFFRWQIPRVAKETAAKAASLLYPSLQ
jgi:hypothetical protein